MGQKSKKGYLGTPYEKAVKNSGEKEDYKQIQKDIQKFTKTLAKMWLFDINFS